MDWLFFLLDSLIFVIIIIALLILAFAAGLVFVKFFGTSNPMLLYGVPLLASLAAFFLGSRPIYSYLFNSMPAMRWLNVFIIALLLPLTAPLIMESLRYCRRELRR